ncbi:MAG: hypothetical protein HY514_02750 [Candidatus Aenigmarchaeota archaeon]|nr:hypothetical protein [Candidatus Aenigmarchaeota archaeon]
MAVNPFPLVDVWLRYAILFHYDYLGKPNHYDILLEIVEGEGSEQLALDKIETTEVLRSLQAAIVIDPKELIRRRYLTYEGPMSGNRGFVKRVDSGTYKLTESDSLEFRGSLLNGRYHFSEDATHLLILRK